MSNNSSKNYVPLKKGSSVQINGNKVRLGEKKGCGGEGEIYALPQNRVAKIYVEEKSKTALLVEKNSNREAKIRHIISIGINDNEIATPIALIYDSSNNFRGYEMPRVSGESLAKLMSSPIPAERWKGWTRKNLIEACYNIVCILNRVYSIPGHDILIGDLNLGNFMSPSPGKVVLIDFDSVQIDNLTCPVGQDKFYPPEILKLITSTSRSNICLKKNNEEFTVAVLLFYILCGGIHPFSKKGGECPAKNILEGEFPYNEDGSASEKAPLVGNPNYYWAFLPPEIRKAFCDTFNSKDINERTSIIQWSSLLFRYLSEFDSLASKDSEANKIVLTRYPKWETPKGTEECIACHQFKPANQISDRLCYTCIRKGYNLRQRRCKYCGTVEYDAILGDRIGGDDSDFTCSNCQKDEKLTCYVCGNSFTVKHYKRKSYILDGKEICPECMNRFEEIKRSISSFQNIREKLPPFENLPFEELFKDVDKKSKEYVPFLKKIDNKESVEYCRNLGNLYLQYKVQAVEFPAYKKKLKELKTKEDTVDSLKRIKGECTYIKNEIAKKEVIIPCDDGQEGMVIKYTCLPYYQYLCDTLQQRIDDARKKLDDFILNKKKEAEKVLSAARSALLPDNFYQPYFVDNLSSISSTIESLKDISDDSRVHQLYDDLLVVQRKSIKGKELKEKTELYIKDNTLNHVDVLSKLKEVYKQVDSYRNDLDESLCNAVQKKLNQKKDEIIQAYMKRPSEVLDKVRNISGVEDFYNINFEDQLREIKKSINLLNKVFEIKSLDEDTDYPNLRGLRDELEKYRDRIEKRKELKEKTEKYFRCNDVDIKKIDEYIFGINEVRSQLSADNSYLDEYLCKYILDILNQRESEVCNVQEYLCLYEALKSKNVHSIYESYGILLMKIPEHIKGFNVDKIQKEATNIWNLCNKYEQAVKAEGIVKKYDDIQHVLEESAPYSEYIFFSDIKTSFQSISHELNEYIQREKRLNKLTIEYNTRKKRLYFCLVTAVFCLITDIWLLVAHLVNLSDGILNVDNRIRLFFWIGWTIGIISFVICMVLYKRKRKH